MGWLARLGTLALAGTASFYVYDANKKIPIPPPSGKYDVAVVGGGIVGLATARHILNTYPNKTVCVIEKEGEVAAHQTGHNSGVIHAGMYYKPGTKMAYCCVEGAKRMYEYCEKNNIPYQRCGKLIVASTEEEFPKVQKLYDFGKENGVEDLEIVYRERIKELEPNVEGYAALYSPNTGIVDYGAVGRSFAKDIENSKRGTIRLRFEALAFEPTNNGTVIIAGKEPGQRGPTLSVEADHVITAAGLYADRVGKRAGGSRNYPVVPFRGTYWQVKPEYRDLVKMNVYPVPSGGGIPVGVHFTPTCNERRDKTVIIGPGACIAFSREGYKFTDINFRDLFDEVTSIGLWKFFINNFNLSVGEVYRDVNKQAFLEEARKLIPTLTDDMVEPSFAGVMGQVFEQDGTAASDYIFEHGCLNGKVLNVRSSPSPACTSSMAIAEEVVKVAAHDFGWKA